MRQLIVAGAVAAMLASCGEEPKTAAQREMDDEKAIAEVEAAQTPPPDVVTPERITDADRTRYGLSDSGCSFAVTNPEVGAQAILQINVGYLKFDGTIERFAPDPGAGDGPAGTKTRYDGGRHALTVRFDQEGAEKAAGSAISVPTQITLQDGRQRTVYVAEGTSRCT